MAGNSASGTERHPPCASRAPTTAGRSREPSVNGAMAGSRAVTVPILIRPIFERSGTQCLILLPVYHSINAPTPPRCFRASLGDTTFLPSSSSHASPAVPPLTGSQTLASSMGELPRSAHNSFLEASHSISPPSSTSALRPWPTSPLTTTLTMSRSNSRS